MKSLDGLMKVWPIMSLDEFSVDPFGEGILGADGFQSAPNGLPRDLRRETRSKRVNGLIGRQLIRLLQCQDIVRMGHLGFGVINIDLAGNQAGFTLGVELLQCLTIGFEEDERHLSGLIIDPNAIGLRTGLARRVATDCDLERRNVALQRFLNGRAV